MAKDSKKNPFEVLGIAKKLVKELEHDDEALLVIAQGMKRALSKKFHADVNADPDAKQRMMDINEAFDFIEKHQKTSFYQLVKQEYCGKGKEKDSKKEILVQAPSMIALPLNNLRVNFGLGKGLFVDSKGSLFTTYGDGRIHRELNKYILGTLPVEAFTRMIYNIDSPDTKAIRLSTNNLTSIPFPFAIPRDISDIVLNATIPDIDSGRYLISGSPKERNQRTLDLFVEGQVEKVASRSTEFDLHGEIAEKKGDLDLAVTYYAESGNFAKLSELGARAAKKGDVKTAIRAYLSAEDFQGLAEVFGKNPSKDARSMIAAYITGNKKALLDLADEVSKKKDNILTAGAAFFLADDTHGYLKCLLEQGRLDEAKNFMSSGSGLSHCLEDLSNRAIELAKDDRSKYDFVFDAYSRIKSKPLMQRLGDAAFSRKHFEEAAKAFRIVGNREDYIKVQKVLGEYEEACRYAVASHDDRIMQEIFPFLFKHNLLDLAYRVASEIPDPKLIEQVAKRSEQVAGRIIKEVFENKTDNVHRRMRRVDKLKKAYRVFLKHASHEAFEEVQGDEKKSLEEKVKTAESLLIQNAVSVLGIARTAYLQDLDVDGTLRVAQAYAGAKDFRSAADTLEKARELVTPDIVYSLNMALQTGDETMCRRVVENYLGYFKDKSYSEKRDSLHYRSIFWGAVENKDYALAEELAKCAAEANPKRAEGIFSELAMQIARDNGEIRLAIDIARKYDCDPEIIRKIVKLDNFRKKEEARKQDRPRPAFQEPKTDEKSKPDMRAIRKKFDQIEETQRKILSVYEAICIEAEKDKLANTKILFSIYGRLGVGKGKGKYEDLAKTLAAAGRTTEAVEASKRSMVEPTEELLGAYDARAEEFMKAKRTYDSVPLYEKSRNYKMLIEIAGQLMHDESPVPEDLRGCVNADLMKLGRCKRALEILYRVNKKCEDKTLLKKVKQKVSEAAKITEDALLTLLRTGGSLERIDAYFKEVAKSTKYLNGPDRLIDKLIEILPNVRQEGVIKKMTGYVYSQYSAKPQAEDPAVNDIKERLLKLSSLLEFKGMYKEAARFIRKSGDRDLELLCGDHALASEKLSDAFDIYAYAGAGKERYFTLLDGAIKLGSQQKNTGYIEKMLGVLNLMVTDEEREGLRAKVGAVPEFAEFLSVLVKPQPKRRL